MFNSKLYLTQGTEKYLDIPTWQAIVYYLSVNLNSCANKIFKNMCENRTTKFCWSECSYHYREAAEYSICLTMVNFSDSKKNPANFFFGKNTLKGHISDGFYHMLLHHDLDEDVPTQNNLLPWAVSLRMLIQWTMVFLLLLILQAGEGQKVS